jgi:hypothetical protein
MKTHTAKVLDTELAHYRSDGHASILADIYEDDLNMVSWKRPLTDRVNKDIDTLMMHHALFNYRVVLSPHEISQWLNAQWQDIHCTVLANDVQCLATMFAELFDVHKIGIRFELVNKTVCPYFHVDKVVSRLVTTYFGPTTEWIKESNTDRKALADRHYDQIAYDASAIHRAHLGEVLLFKGASWDNRQVEPIVHRSPRCLPTQRRLLLTLDML